MSWTHHTLSVEIKRLGGFPSTLFYFILFPSPMLAVTVCELRCTALAGITVSSRYKPRWDQVRGFEYPTPWGNSLRPIPNRSNMWGRSVGPSSILLHVSDDEELCILEDSGASCTPAAHAHGKPETLSLHAVSARSPAHTVSPAFTHLIDRRPHTHSFFIYNLSLDFGSQSKCLTKVFTY